MPIKEAIKKKLNMGSINQEQIITSVSGYKYVSFDIFDTLLKRNVKKPTDVFRVLEYGNSSLKGFTDARIKAEQDARAHSRYEDVTLEEIYTELGNLGFFGLVTPEDEMQTERVLLTVNKPIKEVYDYCLNIGKEIYIISDIYLPCDFIERVLADCGYTGYKKVYVSSECRKTKSTGSLFDLVMGENKILPAELVHIGDSVKSDYHIPKQKGIRAIHIPTCVIGRTVYNYNADSLYADCPRIDSLRTSCLDAFVNNSIPNDLNNYGHFGYECFGPFLWGFSRWLIKHCEGQHIERIFFFSRDGWIMKQAFDTVNKNPALQSSYLEVSRRSLRVPTLWMDCEFDSVIKMVGAKLIPIESIFDGIGLNINDYSSLLQKYGFTQDSVFDRKEVFENEKLRGLYEELKPDIIRNSKKEYEPLKRYIEQNQLTGKFAIVDIGWSGSMQRYLIQTLQKMGIDCDVYGYYTGIASFYTRNTEVIPDMKMKGYLFDFMNDKNAHDVRSCFVGLFESIFLERGGSVKNYAIATTGEEAQDLVICKLNTSKQMGRGTAYAVRYDYEYFTDGKPSRELQCVQQIQEAALEFIKRIAGIRIFENFVYSSKELFANIFEVGAHPQKRDLHMFADFRFFDEGTTLYLAKPQSLIYYLRHPGEMKKDFLMSRWKTGFMKTMFKLPLDYNKAYESLLRYK